MPIYMSVKTKAGSQIKGEASSQIYDEWIVIESCDFQISVDIDAHGGDRLTSTPMPELEPMTIKKRVDTSSPRLMKAMVDKEELAEVKIDVCAEDSRCLFQYILKGEIRLKDYSFALDSEGGHPCDDLALTFTEIELHETSYDDFNAVVGQTRASYRRPQRL